MYIAVHEFSEAVEGLTHLGVTRLDVRPGRVLLRGALGTLVENEFRPHHLMREYVETVRGDAAEALVEAVRSALVAWADVEDDTVRRSLDEPTREQARE